MILNRGVFYRTYLDCTLVYDTCNHKFYRFSNSVGLIFDLIREGYDYENIKVQMAKKCLQPIDNFSSYFDSFIQELYSYNLISEMRNDVTLEERCVFEKTKEIALYSVTFELTYKCNEKCKHCYVCNTNRKELEFSDYKKIFLQLKEMNVINLVFTGGEVLCKKDFIKIYQYAIELGFAVDIYSNGTLFDDATILEIARKHPKSIHFSIYNLREKEHDFITGITGSLKKTLENANKFIDLGVAVNFKTIILKNNYKDIIPMIQYAKKVGATIQVGSSFQLTQQGEKTPLTYMLDQDNAINYLPEIYKEIGLRKDDKIEKRPANSKICSACFSSISINPYGDVFPCISFPLKLGNISETDFIHIWNGEQANEWRSHTFSMIKECSGCECSSVCSFCPGIAMQYNGTPFCSYQNACINTQAVLKYLKGGK